MEGMTDTLTDTLTRRMLYKPKPCKNLTTLERLNENVCQHESREASWCKLFSRQYFFWVTSRFCIWKMGCSHTLTHTHTQNHTHAHTHTQAFQIFLTDYTISMIRSDVMFNPWKLKFGESFFLQLLRNKHKMSPPKKIQWFQSISNVFSNSIQKCQVFGVSCFRRFLWKDMSASIREPLKLHQEMWTNIFMKVNFTSWLNWFNIYSSLKTVWNASKS